MDRCVEELALTTVLLVSAALAAVSVPVCMLVIMGGAMYTTQEEMHC